MTTEESRTFEKDGERYTITVSRGEFRSWEYQVDSETRGVLDRGNIVASDPWDRILAWFPEILATANGRHPGAARRDD